MKVGKALTLAALIKFLLILVFSLVIFIVGISLVLLLTYGALEHIKTGADLVGAVDILVENSDWEIMQIFGEQIFTNIPFADILNAVFITHITPNFASLFPDVVTAALAGLIFFLIARLNVILSKFVKNRVLFGTIVAMMTVISICLAMIATTWMDNNLVGVTLVVARLAVFLLSIILHTLFLFLRLKGIGFFRVMFNLLLDAVVGIFNNVFLWICSYFFMHLLHSSGIPNDMIYIYTLVGVFALYGIYTLLMDKLTSFVWFVTA